MDLGGHGTRLLSRRASEPGDPPACEAHNRSGRTSEKMDATHLDESFIQSVDVLYSFWIIKQQEVRPNAYDIAMLFIQFIMSLMHFAA